jgi:hypothetical protein
MSATWSAKLARVEYTRPGHHPTMGLPRGKQANRALASSTNGSQARFMVGSRGSAPGCVFGATGTLLLFYFEGLAQRKAAGC